MDDKTRRRVAKLRTQGLSWEACARDLNASGIPTPSGRGAWYASTVMRGMDSDKWAAYMRDYRKGIRG